MAKRYIDADALREELNKHIQLEGRLPYWWETIIADYPAADVRENVRGEWIDRSQKLMDGVWECSVCGEEWTIISDPASMNMNFCPNCGADMRGKLDG